MMKVEIFCVMLNDIFCRNKVEILRCDGAASEYYRGNQCVIILKPVIRGLGTV